MQLYDPIYDHVIFHQQQQLQASKFIFRNSSKPIRYIHTILTQFASAMTKKSYLAGILSDHDILGDCNKEHEIA